MKVALVNVGDEILSGDTVNTNATWLASRLVERGVDVERMLVIPDDTGVIASYVGRYSDEFDAVIVTGGLGPTHDDVTVEGIAGAFDLGLEVNNEALDHIQRFYTDDDLAEEAALMPEGASAIDNTQGVAPGFTVRNVYVVPGIPREMKAMFEEIEDEFEGDVLHSVSVTTSTPESLLLDIFDEIRDEFGVSVGSYPGEGEVRVKLSSEDEDRLEEAHDHLLERLEDVPG